MNRALKRGAWAAAGLLALLLLALAAALLVVDPNAFKPLLVERVQRDHQRTLDIPGRIGLSLFPSLGVQLGEVSLSAAGSDQAFAEARAAHVSLAVLPLLRGQWVVDRVQVEGLRLRLVRHADGRTSVDDLLGRAEPAPAPGPAPQATPDAEAAQPLAFDIAGLTLTDATLDLHDEASGRHVEFAGLTLETGRLAPGAASPLQLQTRLRMDAPAVDADVSMAGQLLLAPAQGRYAVEALRLRLAGRLATLTDAELTLDATAALVRDAEGALLSSADTLLQLSGRQGDTVIDGRLQAAWRLDLMAATLAVSNWQVAAALPNPGGGAMKLQAAGDLALGPAPKALQLNAAGTLDASRFRLDVQTARLAPAAWRFGLEVDELDLDRYRAPPPAAGTSSAPAPVAAPLDLSALRGLDLRGSLRVGQLRAARLRLADLRAEVTAAGGELSLRPLQAGLYQGRVQGGATVTASAAPRLAVQAQFNAVSLGPLLQDALGRAPIEGRGDVVLDLRAQGATVPAWTRSLAGDARVALRDGAVQGFNIAQAIRQARAALGRSPAGAAPAGATLSTDFSALDGTFKLAGGVAHTDDLEAKSPLLRVRVVGDVDLGASRLDCRVQATVVGTLQGQGGPELQALRGQTIPVRLQGPFDAIDYTVDLKALATDAVRERAEQQVEQAKEALQDRVRDKLKGLFGK